MIDNPLSPKEKLRYEACKTQISEGLQVCFDTGMALIEIRDHNLYREDFDTFESFCQQTYQIGKAHAYRLIASAEIKKSPIGDKISNERQARAISKVPEERREEVVSLAEKSGNITAQSIAEAAAEIVDSSAPTASASLHQKEKQVDHIGWEIPVSLLPLWNRRQEIESMMAEITNIETRLLQFQKDKDELFAPVPFSSAVSRLQYVHMEVSNAKLWAVCTTCNGRNRANCTHCKKRGFLNKVQWKMVPSEIREMRKQAATKQ